MTVPYVITSYSDLTDPRTKPQSGMSISERCNYYRHDVTLQPTVLGAGSCPATATVRAGSAREKVTSTARRRLPGTERRFSSRLTAIVVSVASRISDFSESVLLEHQCLLVDVCCPRFAVHWSAVCCTLSGVHCPHTTRLSTVCCTYAVCPMYADCCMLYVTTMYVY